MRDLAQQLAQELTKKHPDLVLWKMTKSLRPGKVFLDWSQNVAAKTTSAPTPCAVARRRPACRAAHLGRGRGRLRQDPEALQQLMFDEVLERIDRDGDLLEGLLSD